MIKNEDLTLIGFSEVDENEYTNGKVSLFLMYDGVSIISELMSEDMCLSIPCYRCDDIDVLVDLLDRTGTL